MKKFVFSLESVYGMKENLEKLQKIKLEKIQAEIYEIERYIERINQDYEKTKAEFSDTVASGLDADKAENYDKYFEKLRTAQQQAQERKRQAEHKKERCVVELIEIRKEKVMLEKLRDKEYEAYASEVKKKKDKAADDFFSYKVTIS